MLYEVSVILLTYNRNKGALKALESIFKQTYMNYEVLLIDNGGTEELYKEISDEYFKKSNFDYIRFNDNETVGKRLNQAILLSRGKYITFITDDAFWCPEALEVLFEAINVEGIDLVSGKVKTLDYHSGRYIPNNYGVFTWSRGEIKKINPIHISSVIVSRDLLDDIGGFNESLRKSYDLDLWNRIYRNSKYITGRLDDSISHLVVNNPLSLSKQYSPDLNAADLEIPNLLHKKVKHRFTINISKNNQELIDSINRFRFNILALGDESSENVITSLDHLVHEVSSSGNFLSKYEVISLKSDTKFEISLATAVKRKLISLSEKYFSEYFKKEPVTYKISQDRGGNFIQLNPNQVISQYINCEISEINGIEVYIDPQENSEGKLSCAISVGSEKGITSLSNHQINHGWNKFYFNKIKQTGNLEILVAFKSNVGFFAIEYAQYKSELGSILINKKYINASLKYKIF